MQHMVGIGCSQPFSPFSSDEAGSESAPAKKTCCCKYGCSCDKKAAIWIIIIVVKIDSRMSDNMSKPPASL